MNKISKKLLLPIFLTPLFILMFLLNLTTVKAISPSDEIIEEFNSDVTIKRNGSILVEEVLKFNVTGYSIKHGIYRDIPTEYVNPQGFLIKTPFEIVSVERDGKLEPYTLEDVDGGERVKIGSPNVIIEPGKHTYKIKYYLNRFILYFDDHDEFYYNVNGTGWLFPIAKIKTSIHLPADVNKERIKITAYTGHAGEKGTDFKGEVIDGETIQFESTRRFNSKENMTVVVGYPKGYMAYPSGFDRAFSFLLDNILLIILLISYGLLLIISLLVFLFVGKDPAKGIIVPEFKMPVNMSPGLVRYLEMHGKFDNLGLIANLFSLASKKAIQLEEDGKDYRVIIKSKENTNLLSDEEKLYDALVENGDTFVFNGKKNKRIADMVTKYENNVTDGYSKYFKKNYLATVFYIFITAPLLFFIAMAGTGVSFKLTLLPILMFISAVAIMALTIIFMPKRTKEGRKLQDEIQGIKEYLFTAEESRMKELADTPKEAISLFEKFFPYALAIGVEIYWIKLFKSTLESFQENDYVYTYPTFVYSFSNNSKLTENINALDSKINSTITFETRSNSYSSGRSGGGGFSGGSSGGGGGGGGGGGW